MELSSLIEEVWYESLKDLTNEEGEEAIYAVMRSPVIGDIEPAHVLKKYGELKLKSLLNKNGDEWISKAPKFDGRIDYDWPSKEFCEFLDRERPKRYRSIDSRTGEIVLIQNPAAWDWKIKDGVVFFIRPDAIPTGDYLKNDKKEKRWEGA